MVMDLTTENAVAYLVGHGLVSPEVGKVATAEMLGGGVSNVVIRVSPPDGSGDPVVLKQSLPKLRVEEDWFADRERIHRERAGIDYVVELSRDPASGRTWAVPRVLHEDLTNFIYVMTPAPAGGVNWKDALLSGDVDMAAAQRVGAMLGAIHRASTVVDDDVAPTLRQFEDLECFVQLRIDPYHRATANAHPDLAGIIESEALKMLRPCGSLRALVHGDFSPKNVIVDGSGVDAQVFLLDFEVVHLGNPVFDLAFMLNHFTLKAIHRPGLAGRYNDAAAIFWSSYVNCAGAISEDPSTLERDTVRQMGALLLARIDGKSPAEYITDEGRKDYTRQLARRILTGEVAALEDLHRRLAATND